MAQERADVTASEPGAEARGAAGARGKAAAREPSAALQAENGTTTIADAVVEKVVGIAAREVPGVHELGGGSQRALGAVTERVGLGDERSRGVSVEVGEREAAVDLTIVIDYGESIPNICERVRDNVTKRVEGIVGLSVAEVNISVNDLYFPGEEEEGTRVQ